MPSATRRAAASVIAALAAVVTLVGCASTGSQAAGTPAAGTPAAGAHATGTQAAGTQATGPGGSDLATALDLLPDASGGYVTYTNWSILQHRDATRTASFAGELATIDPLLQRDLGIRSTSARWEADVLPLHSRPPLVLFRFDQSGALAALPGKLARYGYHRNGPILTGPRRSSRVWVYGLHNVGIDLGRHLLVASYDAAAVRTVLARAAHPLEQGSLGQGSLGQDKALRPLLALASTQLGGIATASIAIGSSACMKLANLAGRRLTPEILTILRKRFTGTLTPPQAEIIALATPDSTSALDALTFPGHQAAEANRAARAAAVKTMDALDHGDPNQIMVKSSAVTGRVLSLNLSAAQSQAFVARVQDNAIGADVCRQSPAQDSLFVRACPAARTKVRRLVEYSQPNDALLTADDRHARVPE